MNREKALEMQLGLCEQQLVAALRSVRGLQAENMDLQEQLAAVKEELAALKPPAEPAADAGETETQASTEQEPPDPSTGTDEQSE